MSNIGKVAIAWHRDLSWTTTQRFLHGWKSSINLIVPYPSLITTKIPSHVSIYDGRHAPEVQRALDKSEHLVDWSPDWGESWNTQQKWISNWKSKGKSSRKFTFLKKNKEDNEDIETTLLTSFWMQRILENPWKRMIQGGVLSLPLKNLDCVLYPLDVIDIARGLETLLVQPTGVYNLAGPEQLSWKDIGKCYAKNGHPVRLSSIPRWAAKPAMWMQGYSPEAIAAYLNTCAKMDAQWKEDPAPFFEDGIPLKLSEMHTVGAFIKENREAWKESLK